MLETLLRWKSEAIFRTNEILTTNQDYNLLGDGRQGWSILFDIWSTKIVQKPVAVPLQVFDLLNQIKD